jgi:hypothetical protein
LGEKKEIVLKCKEIAGLDLDLNLHHKCFRLHKWFDVGILRIFFIWKMKKYSVFSEMHGN